LFACGAVCGSAATLFSGLRHRITYMRASRDGLVVDTNSGEVGFEIMGELEQIDSTVSISVRKGTTRLMLLDPAKYGTTPEVMLVNHKAMLCLVYAAYENHHTRELNEKGAESYLADKTNDVMETVAIWRDKLPMLTYEFTEGYVCLWIKNVLIKALRKACYEKIDLYQRLLKRKNISVSLRENIKMWLEKNENYVVRIDELSECSAIQDKSSILLK
jgi:hypothetical protein